MQDECVLESIADAMVSIDDERVKDLTEKALQQGLPPLDILQKGLAKGLEIVGRKYEDMEYFLTELILSSEIMKNAMDSLKPYLEKEPVKTRGVCLIGTVRGDIHDLGKNLVISLLRSEFDVHDLGVDVPTKAFVDKVREIRPQILGMSAMLLSTMPAMKDVIDELEGEGLKDEVKVMVGGRVLSGEVAEEYGADGYAKDAVEALRVAKQLLNKR